jgi:hypothetical protein
MTGKIRSDPLEASDEYGCSVPICFRQLKLFERICHDRKSARRVIFSSSFSPPTLVTCGLQANFAFRCDRHGQTISNEMEEVCNRPRCYTLGSIMPTKRIRFHVCRRWSPGWGGYLYTLSLAVHIVDDDFHGRFAYQAVASISYCTRVEQQIS